MQDLHELPKLRDSLSYAYLEHAVINQAQHALEVWQTNGRTLIPTANLSLLILGPGTSITHAAIRTLADHGTSIIWSGTETTKFYASGTGETRKAQHLLRQAELMCNPDYHEQVVIRMYRYRFRQTLPEGLSLPQIRGMEGVRVRQAYAEASKKYGVVWKGRNYKRNDWATADPINRAISAANALLNGICHAAIISGGYSPALGFVHTGKQLSFVYDIADLYKVETTIPIAFQAVAQSTQNLEQRIRQICRQKFTETKLLQRILPDIDHILNITAPLPHSELMDELDSDSALPTALWHKLLSDNNDTDPLPNHIPF